ncbi:F-box/kelch-repeat protein At3g06240-like [Durio zibethinus]|uniref:F-box/kelch-repeat protein At3g06240-like n=1 Tax=Durio zibethinus TaxID=66656 RepID=A0A6P5Y1A9_DURZI|nr:F-box/kelch-repeat protein At3g06240-like [Durio zibethinus]
MVPMMKKQMGMVQLPDDLIIEIMARLPPKSALRFRCLSKSWKAFLSSPNFIRMHLNHVTENKYKYMQQLVLSSTYSLQLMNYTAYKKTASTLDFPMEYPNWKRFPTLFVMVLGSCNGLLCAAVPTKTLIIWNPSIREFKKLPLSCPLNDSKLDGFGFGYDHSTDDYKVIRFLYSIGRGLLLMGSFIGLVICLDNPQQGQEGGPCSDTAHWILGFDLTFDKFEAFPPPKDLKEESKFTLGVIGGCLSLAQNLYGDRIEMWKLDKGDTKKGWIKVMTIMNPQRLPCPYGLVPICIMKNGEVLLSYDEIMLFSRSVTKPRRFVLYDTVKGTFRKLKIDGIGQWSRAIPYIESLVSPNLI